MKKIISVSRRTDIPAFYGEWFMRRLKEGFAGVVSPFGGRKYIVPLKAEDVVCFVFWSKNFMPFLENMKVVEEMGYKFYFNYTINSLPEIFESDVERKEAIEGLKQLSRKYSPQHINWRFDPIIISNVCDRDFYIKTFKEFASEFEGMVKRCYFSFVTEYGKVKRNFQELEQTSDVKMTSCSEAFKIELAKELAEIAKSHGMQMFSCCGEYLVNDGIQKGHCIDGSVIESLFFPEGLAYKEKPTRDECGCTESSDIGTYDTCPHGCVYCYANVNREKAVKMFDDHDNDSAFLGFSKSKSDRWLEEIKNSKAGGQLKF